MKRTIVLLALLACACSARKSPDPVVQIRLSASYHRGCYVAVAETRKHGGTPTRVCAGQAVGLRIDGREPVILYLSRYDEHGRDIPVPKKEDAK